MDNDEHKGPFNVGNPGEFTMVELAEMVKEVINPQAEVGSMCVALFWRVGWGTRAWCTGRGRVSRGQVPRRQPRSWAWCGGRLLDHVAARRQDLPDGRKGRALPLPCALTCDSHPGLWPDGQGKGPGSPLTEKGPGPPPFPFPRSDRVRGKHGRRPGEAQARHLQDHLAAGVVAQGPPA